MSKIKKVTRILRTRGLSGLIHAIDSRIWGLLAIRSKSYQAFKSFFRGKKGLEIGGPSKVFARRNIFPVYPIVGQLDNCNYSSETVWEVNIERGQVYHFDLKKPPGRQFIAEATALGSVPPGIYDFVLSSHMLEHSANPILALREWIRILKDQGMLVMLLPHKDGTFDHRRPVTTMEHLVADFDAGMTENDLTHMPEILALHDLDLDPEAGDSVAFKARSLRNSENRCFHHHVFDTSLAVSLVNHMGLQLRAVETIQPMHILVVAQKLKAGDSMDNSAFVA